MSLVLPETGSGRQNAKPFETDALAVKAPGCGRCFLVGQDRDGHWIAKESYGRAGGIFVSSQAAIDYAEFETNHRPGAVRLVRRPLELEI
jgi:hypothetical protein